MHLPIFRSRLLWEPDSYARHRIPGLLLTARGTLLVCCEARDDPSDWARMDILLQRSTDGGQTFSPPVILARGTADHPTVNNPVMMEDTAGRVHLLYCEDYGTRGGRILHRISTDDGLTFGDPIDITAATAPDYRNAFAFGPGHGICLPDGTLLVPVWMVPKDRGAPEQSHVPSVLSTIYSRDSGNSWQLGEILDTIPGTQYDPSRHVGGPDGVVSPNETVAALTEEGEVYLNIRQRGPRRVRAWSKTGFSDWKDYSPDPALIDPQCFGSVAAFAPAGRPYTLLLVNCESETARDHTTVKGSLDGGRTWPLRCMLDETRGGYADIAADSAHDRVYILYEDQGGLTDTLAVFNYAWLAEGTQED